MCESVLNVTFIIARWLNEPSITWHFIILPIAFIVRAVVKDKDTSTRSITVLVIA
jgi:hypothetical protein